MSEPEAVVVDSSLVASEEPVRHVVRSSVTTTDEDFYLTFLGARPLIDAKRGVGAGAASLDVMASYVFTPARFLSLAKMAIRVVINYERNAGRDPDRVVEELRAEMQTALDAIKRDATDPPQETGENIV